MKIFGSALMFVMLITSTVFSGPITYSGMPLSGGTFTGDVIIGTTSTGYDLSIVATLGTEEAPALTAGNWTVGAGWESPIVGPGLIKNADGTGTQTPSAATTIVAGTTYKVVITLSALTVGTASYTVGGMGGSSLTAATTYTDYITASTTGKLIITPTNTSRFTISAISIKALTDATGDLTVDGNLIVRSPSTFEGPLIVPDGILGSLSIKYKNFPTTGFYAANFSPYGICQTWVNEGAAGGYLCGEGVTFGTSQAVNWNDDITIFREQAGFLGIGYQGVSPAQFDVWGVYTDGSNNEKMYLNSAAGLGTLGVSSAGSGSANINIAIAPKGTGNLIVGHTAMVGGAGSGYIEAHVSSDLGGLNLINWSTADTNRSIVSLEKSGNATKGTHGVIADNEYIGTFLFHASDGTAFKEVAVVQALIDGTPGAGDTPGRLVFGTTPDNNITAVERYRIDNAGKHYWWLTSPGMGAGVTGNYEGLSLTLSSGAATLAGETGGTGADNIDLVLTPAGTGGVQNFAANITVGAGTGITVNQSGTLNRQTYKVTTTYAAYSDVDTKKGIVIATLPAKTKLVGAYADTTAAYTGGAITATTLVVGITAEDGAQIIASHDVFAGAITKGLADADMGTGMTRAAQIQGGYLPSWTGTTAIYATITTTTANTNALTAGSTTFYLVTERF